jgi:hypothetical protein
MSIAATEAVAPGSDSLAASQRKPWRRIEIAAATANLVIACAIVAWFHDRFWWPADDGAYAYIADRLRNGAVLGRDLHDIHGGYIHFLNAFALDLFGRDMLSLRYPLAVLTVAQSAIVFLLLRPRLGAAAIVGGIAMAALTFVQFLNPTANWYTLFLSVVVAALLAGGFQRTFAGLIAIGFTIGMIFFFRQLTGVLVGIGTLAWLLIGDEDNAARGRALAARALAAIIATGLAAYAFFRVEPAALVLYAVLPLLFLAVTALRPCTDGRRLLGILSGMATGALLSALPLLLYHAFNNSLADWWHDATLSAVALTELRFFGEASYTPILLLALRGVVTLANPVGILNGLSWILVLITPALLGISVLRVAWRGDAIPPVAVIALFFAVVSAHYAIPIYAIYGTGFALVGLLAMVRTPNARATAMAITLFAAIIGIVFQAGQPLSRGVVGTIQGTRVALEADGIPGASVHMEPADKALYERLLRFIDDHAPPGTPILGLPMTPQLYFLSGRSPPLRFVIAPLGLLSDGDVDQSWNRLQATMPAVVIFRPDDKYTTPRVRALMDRLRPHYELCAADAGFELYAPACAARIGDRGLNAS